MVSKTLRGPVYREDRKDSPTDFVFGQERRTTPESCKRRRIVNETGHIRLQNEDLNLCKLKRLIISTTIFLIT